MIRRLDAEDHFRDFIDGLRDVPAVFQFSEGSTLSLPDWFGYTVIFSDRILRYAIDSWVVPSGKAMTIISGLKWSPAY